MGAIFTSPGRTVGAGVVLLVIIIAILHATGVKMFALDHNWSLVLMRWLHIVSGVLWIGLLWYLNFVQVPTMPSIPVENRSAISKHIAPNVLFYFRYGALATVLTGLLLAAMSPGNYLVNALTLAPSHRAIGIGMWMALIMAFNVWFIIWPNQQKILGLVDCPADQKPKAARLAMLTSRTNTLLSLPMLYCMAAQSHGGF